MSNFFNVILVHIKVVCQECINYTDFEILKNLYYFSQQKFVQGT